MRKISMILYEYLFIQNIGYVYNNVNSSLNYITFLQFKYVNTDTNINYQQ